MELVTIVLLASVIVIQQFFFMWQIHKLTDKLMSRSFAEYVRAKEPPLRVKLDNEVPDDLRTLQEFSLG